MTTPFTRRLASAAFVLVAFWMLTPAALLAQEGHLPRTAPEPQTTTQTQPAATGGDSSAPAGDKFISLTQLPGIDSFESTSSLPDFFNNLYKLCIGAAALIAVLQIMRAGIKFMTNKGSVSSNQAAKDLIQNAILGLVLVLSPAIVFGIINPRILNLELDVSNLTPEDLKPLDVGTLPGFRGSGEVIGSLLKKGTFSTEAAMNEFIGSCPALAKETFIVSAPAENGKAMTKGCTKSCSLPGQGTCDAKGCSEYTAYCSMSVTVSIYENSRKPNRADKALWEKFIASCQESNGSPKSVESSSRLSCLDENDQSTTCLSTVLSCEPK